MNSTILKMVLLISLIQFSCSETGTEVVVLSTIHGAHQVNPNYSYDDLFTFIDSYDPDIIGVEIREEDIDSSDAYLKRSYPFEMRECIRMYPGKEIYGIDWLGDAIEGRAIPADYFRELEVKVLERRLNEDSAMAIRLSVIDSLAEQKKRIVLEASLRELNSGTYDSLNAVYYEKLNLVLGGTPYRGMTEFYLRRDQRIADNIIETIDDNRGKRMLFLVGADHRGYTLDRISMQFRDSIVLNDAIR